MSHRGNMNKHPSQLCLEPWSGRMAKGGIMHCLSPTPQKWQGRQSFSIAETETASHSWLEYSGCIFQSIRTGKSSFPQVLLSPEAVKCWALGQWSPSCKGPSLFPVPSLGCPPQALLVCLLGCSQFPSLLDWWIVHDHALRQHGQRVGIPKYRFIAPISLALQPWGTQSITVRSSPILDWMSHLLHPKQRLLLRNIPI